MTFVARLLAAILAALLFVQPAAAQLLTLGAGGSGGAANIFAPVGVQFAKSNTGKTSALLASGGGTIADTSKFILSFWQRASWLNSAIGSSTTATNLRIISSGDAVSSCEPGAGICIVIDNASAHDASLRINIGSALGATVFNGTIPWVATNNPFPNTDWNHFYISCDMRAAGGKRICAAYLNKVQLTDATLSDSGTQFDINWSQPGGFFVGGPNDATNQRNLLFADIAEPWLDTTHSDVQADGTVPAADLAKFIDANGKPVSVGADGSTPFGYQPTVYLTGGAQGFTSNLGYGGAFTSTVNSTTNGIALQDAPVTPGAATAHRVALQWRNSQNNASLGSSGSTVTLATSPVNNKIRAGELLLIAEEMSCSGNNDPGAFPTPTGFTQVDQQYEASTSTVRWAIFRKIADGTENGVSTLNPTSCGGTGGVTYVLADYAGVNATTPIDVKLLTQNASSTNITCTGVTTTVDNDLLVGLAMTFAANRGPYTIPAGEKWRMDERIFATTRQQIMLTDEQLGVAGATGTKTFTANSANPSRCMLLALAPA